MVHCAPDPSRILFASSGYYVAAPPPPPPPPVPVSVFKFFSFY